jgi:hypothetical protein
VAPIDVAPALSGAELDAVDWVHRSRTFEALGHRFAVRSTASGIGRYIDRMYAGCVTAAPGPVTWYSLLDDVGSGAPHALYVGEDRLVQSVRPAAVLNHLTWHVNRRVIAQRGDEVLLHAAAVSLDGLGVLLPAAMEAGKTTLSAGLIRSGFDYLTDEAAAIDPATRAVRSYAKPLSLDPGSWPVLPDLRPDVDTVTAAYLEDQWQVPADAIRPESFGSPANVAVIVLPRYAVGSPTTLRRVRRSAALVATLEQTFHFHEHGANDLATLARVVGQARCYRLVSGDLAEACAAVTRVVRGDEAGVDDEELV